MSSVLYAEIKHKLVLSIILHSNFSRRFSFYERLIQLGFHCIWLEKFISLKYVEGALVCSTVEL